jgi:hypothetical protein
MSDFQLSQIALVAARMSAFESLGYQTRQELAMRRVTPADTGKGLGQLEELDRREVLREQLPIWVHNVLTDPEFPQRDKLLLPLRRFEGELRDNKNDEVVSAVLSHGFRNQNFNPLALPKDLPMRERCAILAHLQVWEDAFHSLEEELVGLLSKNATSIDRWCDYARHPDHGDID